MLILGGTAWLGREVAEQAVAAGGRVTCLARGASGNAPAGADLLAVDRRDPGAYDAVRKQQWDSVIEVSWQPGLVRGALQALAGATARWTYVSSISVYAEPDTGELDESADVVGATGKDAATIADYAAAKVACEQAVRSVIGDRALIARAGLIGGPGDHTDRTGYWPAAAARDPAGPLLVPDAPDLPVQVIDARDLARWLLDTAAVGLTGTFDAVGPPVSFHHWVEASRQVAGHAGPVVSAAPSWLLARGVGEWMGPESLPLWVAAGDRAVWPGTSARNAGLPNRPITDMLADTLEWERARGLDRPRLAGLSISRSQELLSALDS
jgi:2'-hydroxyisoflavone reductase